MGNLLRTWWPVMLLVCVPDLLHLLARAIHRVTLGALDRQIEDDLPWTAGEWLREQVRALGLDRTLAVVTSEHASDSYVPWERTIHLADTTYFKRDPLYWAIAAHELGHAQFHLWHSRLAAVTHTRWPRWLALSAGLALLLGNVFFARAAIEHFAFVTLATAAVLAFLPLCEELVASAFAWRLLRRARVLTRRHRVAAFAALATAFGTYALTFAGRLFLLARWDVIVSITGNGHATTGGLTRLGELALVLCTVALVFHALVATVQVKRGGGLPGFGLFELGVSLVVVWLAWDGGHGELYMWCVYAACVPAADLAVMLLSLPARIAYVMVRRLAARVGDGVDKTRVFWADRVRGAAQIEAGNAWWKALAPPRTFAYQASRVWPLLALPLAVAYWFA